MYYLHHRIAIKIYDLGNNEQKVTYVKNNSYLCRRKTESIMGKVIIITGASSGFGKAIAERLASHGHTVYGICRREMQHDKINYRQGDIRDVDRIQQIANEIYEKEGHIDVLINNAGMKKYCPICVSSVMGKSSISAQ